MLLPLNQGETQSADVSPHLTLIWEANVNKFLTTLQKILTMLATHEIEILLRNLYGFCSFMLQYFIKIRKYKNSFQTPIFREYFYVLLKYEKTWSLNLQKLIFLLLHIS